MSVHCYLRQTRYDDGTETVRRQLIACLPLLEYTHSDCIEQLVVIWRSVVHRVYHYYQQSARAYFTYLQLNSGVGLFIVSLCLLSRGASVLWIKGAVVNIGNVIHPRALSVIIVYYYMLLMSYENKP